MGKKHRRQKNAHRNASLAGMSDFTSAAEKSLHGLLYDFFERFNIPDPYIHEHGSEIISLPGHSFEYWDKKAKELFYRFKPLSDALDDIHKEYPDMNHLKRHQKSSLNALFQFFKAVTQSSIECSFVVLPVYCVNFRSLNGQTIDLMKLMNLCSYEEANVIESLMVRLPIIHDAMYRFKTSSEHIDVNVLPQEIKETLNELRDLKLLSSFFANESGVMKDWLYEYFMWLVKTACGNPYFSIPLIRFATDVFYALIVANNPLLDKTFPGGIALLLFSLIMTTGAICAEGTNDPLKILLYFALALPMLPFTEPLWAFFLIVCSLLPTKLQNEIYHPVLWPYEPRGRLLPELSEQEERRLFDTLIRELHSNPELSGQLFFHQGNPVYRIAGLSPEGGAIPAPIPASTPAPRNGRSPL